MPKLNDYELLEIIGSGSYSVVHRAKHKVSSYFSCSLSLSYGFEDKNNFFFLGDETIICHKMCGQSKSVEKFNGQFTQGNQIIENSKAQIYCRND